MDYALGRQKLGVGFSAQDIEDLKAQLRVSEIKVDLPTFG